MSSELEEWRFVIESRRSRSRRRQIKKKKNFLRPYTKLQKRLAAGDSGRESPPAV